TAATAATSCPANRTLRDSVVHTAFTPGWASAFAVSIFTISPAGMAARIIFPHSIPGTLMSKVYLARPVTFAGPSIRGWRPVATLSLLSRSHGLRSPSAAWTSRGCGLLAWPALTLKVTLGPSGCCCCVMALAPHRRLGLRLRRLLHGLEHAL